jgi:hypothetical protein
MAWLEGRSVGPGHAVATESRWNTGHRTANCWSKLLSSISQRWLWYEDRQRHITSTFENNQLASYHGQGTRPRRVTIHSIQCKANTQMRHATALLKLDCCTAVWAGQVSPMPIPRLARPRPAPCAVLMRGLTARGWRMHCAAAPSAEERRGRGGKGDRMAAWPRRGWGSPAPWPIQSSENTVHIHTDRNWVLSPTQLALWSRPIFNFYYMYCI